jgi:hypothetical protein
MMNSRKSSSLIFIKTAELNIQTSYLYTNKLCTGVPVILKIEQYKKKYNAFN